MKSEKDKEALYPDLRIATFLSLSKHSLSRNLQPNPEHTSLWQQDLNLVPTLFFFFYSSFLFGGYHRLNLYVFFFLSGIVAILFVVPLCFGGRRGEICAVFFIWVIYIFQIPRVKSWVFLVYWMLEVLIFVRYNLHGGTREGFVWNIRIRSEPWGESGGWNPRKVCGL